MRTITCGAVRRTVLQLPKKENTGRDDGSGFTQGTAIDWDCDALWRTESSAQSGGLTEGVCSSRSHPQHVSPTRLATEWYPLSAVDICENVPLRTPMRAEHAGVCRATTHVGSPVPCVYDRH